MNNDNQHIPSGYKLSPLGIIPEDWKVKRLGDFSRFFSGGTPKSGNPLFYNGDIPFIRSGEINKDKTELFLSQEGVDNSSAKLVEEGDILYALYGANSGQCSLSKIQGAINQAILCIRPKANKYYVMSVLQLNKEHYYNSFLQGGQGNLSGEIVSNYRLAIPPIEEQERVCNVLQLWDTAIAKQTALIEKLTLRKRGLMQQLLTGKKRLKGFGGEWKTIELGDALSYIQPTKYLVVSENYNNTYNTPVLTAGKTFILGYTDETTGVFNDLPAIIFDDFTTESKYVTFPFKAKSSAMKILKAHNSNLYFMFCAMQMIKYSIGGHERHWISKFSHLTLKVPSLEEQNAIASVLVQSDKEIEIQKQKMARLQEQKKGLMQVLLTGKRRIK